MPKLLSLIFSLLLPAQAIAMGGTVPSGYPGHFMMGYVAEYHVDGAGRYVPAGSEFNTLDHYMAPIGAGWDATYKYIIGGPRAAGGPNSWWNAWPGSGAMPTAFMNHANSRSFQPIIIYMNLQAHSGNYPAGIHAAFQSSTFMGQYFSDWADLMTVVNNWLTANPTKVVTIDVEPDAWGYMQQNYSNDPALIPASVASATNPGGAYPWVPLGAYPNTVQGVSRALLHIKDVRLTPANRSRLKLALHVSSWATSPNPATTQSAMNVLTHANTVAGFLNACKTTVTAGADWDLWFLDPADGDAALYQVNGLNGAGSTHWWDENNATQPTFNRYRDWVNALSTATDRRAMLWQMPIGNRVYRTLNNTHGHYQDNRIEYFLNPTNGRDNVCDWAANGVLGILWGRGSIIPVGGGYTVGTGGPDYWHISWATDYSGGTQDNITNAGATGINATVADDDGGYLRARMPSYFSNRCTLPGGGSPATATRTPTPTPTRTATRTATQTATRSATPTASPSRTATPSATVSSTRTATGTGTPSASPSLTSSPTRTPGPSDTASPTRSASPSPSASTTVSSTRSASPTPSPTSTHSTSITPSPTSTLGVNSPTVTSTATSTHTDTSSPTVSLTHTIAVGSPTATPTPSASTTPSPTSTHSASITPSPTSTHSASITPSPTSTHSASTTPSPTSTLGVNSPTATPTLVPTQGVASGPNEILDAVPWPNPNPRALKVQLAGSSDQVTVQIYSRAFVLLGQADSAGPHSAGWVSADLPALDSLPAGAYFFRVQSLRQGNPSLKTHVGSLMLLR